jgi:uncharacterized protein (UPF0332 family)
MPLTKKEIEFLEDLEIRLLAQANAKTKNIKDKLLISGREFHKFWCVLDKLEEEYKQQQTTNKKTSKTILEKRKISPYYAYGQKATQQHYRAEIKKIKILLDKQDNENAIIRYKKNIDELSAFNTTVLRTMLKEFIDSFSNDEFNIV